MLIEIMSVTSDPLVSDLGLNGAWISGANLVLGLECLISGVPVYRAASK